jgi:hypothetical protein
MDLELQKIVSKAEAEARQEQVIADFVQAWKDAAPPEPTERPDPREAFIAALSGDRGKPRRRKAPAKA